MPADRLAGRLASRPASLLRRAVLLTGTASAAAACSRLTFFAANAPDVFGPYERRTDIPYGADPLQRLDVYTPRADASRPRPMVVFWHGGRWESGDKRDYRFVGAAMARLDCVAVVANF